MPKITEAEKDFATRLGKVLVAMREQAGFTREEMEGHGFPLSTLGKWERGNNAPKAFDLGRLYLFFKERGADPAELLDPPAVIQINPTKDRLRELERIGAIAVGEREARVAARRQRTAAKRAGGPDTPAKRTQPRSPR